MTPRQIIQILISLGLAGGLFWYVKHAREVRLEPMPALPRHVVEPDPNAAPLSFVTIARAPQAEGRELRLLHNHVVGTLTDWTERLSNQVGDGFPEKVTAFHPMMSVHGRFGEPCPVCKSPVQRIVYADNETNYCARCQTAGKLLADRSLSRLLKEDWPRTLD